MKYKSPRIPSYSRFSFKRLFSWTVVVCVSLAMVGIFSKTVHASIASLVTSMLGGESVSAEVVSSIGMSSQTIVLLQAPVNIDPNPERSDEVVPVADGVALVVDLAMNNAENAHKPANTQISIYTVQPGDTLSGIGEMFDVSVNTILWANSITKATSIQPGDILVILPVSGVTHTVKSGETISGIAEKYDADLDEMLQYNDLTLSSTLTVGQSIILPDVELSSALPTHIVKSSSGGTVQSSSYYIRPIKGGKKSQGIHGYNGVDLAAPSGTPIYAAAEGTVIVSLSGAWNGGYGNFIIIHHPNNTQTLYAHNSKNLVKNGEYVEQGDLIALMGSTGKSTGNHVHFEIRGAKNPF